MFAGDDLCRSADIQISTWCSELIREGWGWPGLGLGFLRAGENGWDEIEQVIVLIFLPVMRAMTNYVALVAIPLDLASGHTRSVECYGEPMRRSMRPVISVSMRLL